MRSADALRAAIAANRRDFDARYELAQGHFAAGRFTDAMDELLEIVMRDKRGANSSRAETYVAILDLMSKPAPKASPEAAQRARSRWPARRPLRRALTRWWISIGASSAWRCSDARARRRGAPTAPA